MFKLAEVLIYSSIFDFQKKIALYGEVFFELIETLLMLISRYNKKLLAESSPRNLEDDLMQKKYSIVIMKNSSAKNSSYSAGYL